MADREPINTSPGSGVQGTTGVSTGESGLRREGAAEWLELNGAFFLLLGGIAMIALACIFASKVAIAPVFAVFGSAQLILAAFYTRMEGPVQANRMGVAFAIRAARRHAHERGLSPEQEAEALEQAVELVDLQSRRFSDVRQAGEAAGREAVQRLSHRDLVDKFALWLVSDGEFQPDKIAKDVRTGDDEVDLVAQREDEILIAEIATKPQLLNAGSVFRLLSLALPDRPEDAHVRRAFVVPMDQHDEAWIPESARIAKLEIYTVSRAGQVERLQ